MALADQHRILGLALAESWRRFRGRFITSVRERFRLSGSAPERLIIAPPDLGTSDPTVAQEIYSGVFFFAGKYVDTAGASPFATEPPSLDWARELNSFGWLCHLEAAGGPLSTNNAQALIRDWLALHGKPSKTIAWRVDIAAERLIAWLSHSLLVVENADHGFYRQFLRSIGQHIRYLQRSAPDAPAGLPRLAARIALAYAAVCVAGQNADRKSALKALDLELSRQILPDGGHVSRNPASLPVILAWLLPLRQSFVTLGTVPSPDFVSAVDRMLTAIRFYRLGDGGFARFNGASVTSNDLVATVLRYDDVHGEVAAEATHSGYQRLSLGDTVVLMDTGMPPRGEISRTAHAGCLSFEMSSGRSPLIVNCGAPVHPGRETMAAARTTAAHSTATVNDTSSCRFKLEGVIGRYLDNRIIGGPQKVTSRREDGEDLCAVTASHDGYGRGFGIVHERSLFLDDAGNRLAGLDRFLGLNGRPPRHATRDKVAIRFHLHPTVEVEPGENGNDVLLWTGADECWRFASRQIEPQIEESVYFASASGPKRSLQIVLNAKAAEHGQIDWVLERQRVERKAVAPESGGN